MANTQAQKLMTTTALQLLLSMPPGIQTQNFCPLLPGVGGGHCLASRCWEHESTLRELSPPNPDEDFQNPELDFSRVWTASRSTRCVACLQCHTRCTHASCCTPSDLRIVVSGNSSRQKRTCWSGEITKSPFAPSPRADRNRLVQSCCHCCLRAEWHRPCFCLPCLWPFLALSPPPRPRRVCFATCGAGSASC